MSKHISEKAGKYFTQSGVIAFKRMHVDVMGDVVGALWLSQLAYWSPKTKRGDGYVYKSYAEWEEETGLSQYQVKRCADKAEEMGIIDRKLKKANGAPTLHYRLNQAALTAKINSIIKELNNPLSRNLVNLDYEETQQSLTETTQENTTDNNNNDGRVFSVYEQEIGPLTPMTSDIIGDAIDNDHYSNEWIIEAIKIASKNNVRKWSYVEAILENWWTNGKNKEKVADPALEARRKQLLGR